MGGNAQARRSFYQHGQRVFWDVHNPENTVVIELQDERYNELIVEVADPNAAVELVKRARTAVDPGAGVVGCPFWDNSRKRLSSRPEAEWLPRCLRQSAEPVSQRRVLGTLSCTVDHRGADLSHQATVFVDVAFPLLPRFDCCGLGEAGGKCPTCNKSERDPNIAT